MRVHPGVQKNLYEGDKLGEQKPDIDEFYIRSGRKALRDANEESCEHKESSKIDGYNGFKEKVFEEVGRINNGQY